MQRAFSKIAAGLLVGAMFSSVGMAADVRVTMKTISAEGIGKTVGTVTLRDSADLGLIIIPDLKGLPPGAHGFHIHEKPDCAPATADGKATAGGAAGGHLDPEKTGHHAGPAGNGHRGDLPQLLVDEKGDARAAVIAPRLQTSDIIGHALMIHAGGDNYADAPEKLGGGGARIACGVIAAGSIKSEERP